MLGDLEFEPSQVHGLARSSKLLSERRVAGLGVRKSRFEKEAARASTEQVRANPGAMKIGQLLSKQLQ